jgi:hypothetical protein
MLAALRAGMSLVSRLRVEPVQREIEELRVWR